MFAGWATRAWGHDVPEPGATAQPSRLSEFQTAFLICVVGEVLFRRTGRLWEWPQSAPAWMTLLCCAFCFARPKSSVGLWVTAVAWVLTFTDSLTSAAYMANHQVLAPVILAVLALHDAANATSERMALRNIRAIAGAVFFGSGLQKLLYGHYGDGQFLAVFAVTDPRFHDALSYFAPAEIRRLMAVGVPYEGAGPYAIEWLPALLVTRGTVLAEMAIGILIVIPKTQNVAALLGLAMLLGIELVAHEFTFGIMFANLLLACLSYRVGFLGSVFSIGAFGLILVLRQEFPRYLVN
jgi:hypothetical protein